MGTRHLILVYYKGAYHIAQYGQWDGYPEGQGFTVLKFVRDAANIAKLQAAIDNNMLYTPTNAQLKEWDEEAHRLEHERRERRQAANGTYIHEDFPLSPYQLICPSLCRDTGAKILQLVADATEPVPIVEEIEFIADTLFCEWAYVVDLDKRVLEVYSGGTPGTPGGRFEELGGPGMRANFGFDDLPEERDFIRAFQ